jgi:hypothetical protein
MTSVLSPQAAPFYPLSFEPINLVVYNNGIPSLAFYHGSESEILHGISDEGMDEAFPPTAEDVAELEAVELFVSLMANLAMMEEREEAARETHAGFMQRWEVRRKQVAHPLPPKHLVHRVSHGEHHLLDSSSLVAFDHSDRIQEHRMRARDSAQKAKPKTSKMMGKPAFRKPIQQPRKSS